MLTLLRATHALAQQPARTKIVGTWSGVLLPVVDDDKLDWHQVNRTIDALIAARVDGIYTSGTAEELWSLTDGEFLTLGDAVSSRRTRVRPRALSGAHEAHGAPFRSACA